MATVVIVDDDIDIIDSFVELLKLKKIDVVGIGYDGKQAVELCEKYNPDFLLLDLSMPEFDGFYTLEKLQNQTTKIIVITGVIDENIIEKIKSFSTYSILRKPINYDKFFKILDGSSNL